MKVGATPSTRMPTPIPWCRADVATIVAMLAVLGCGAAYLPVDITLPAARIETILRQANPALVITEAGHAELAGLGLPALVLDDSAVAEHISRLPATAPVVRRDPDHCAYVIFTSGSTGEPKGVVGTNAAALVAFRGFLDFDDVGAQKSELHRCKRT